MTEMAGAVMVGRPPEWWEWAQDLRTRWLLKRPELLRKLTKLFVVGAIVVVVYLVVLAIVVPVTRWSIGAYAGTYWALATWFLLARTKTLAWPTMAALFGALLVWSGVVAFVSYRLITSVGLSPNTASVAATAVPIIEECGKLLPIAFLALVAPGRVRRLSVTDWLLLGLASGLAYEGMEEGFRRIYFLAVPNLSFCYGDPSQVLKCQNAHLYGWWPFSSAFGSVADYAGHGIVTALVTISIGLALRISTSRSLPRWRYIGWLWPLWVFWVALVTHAAINGSPERGPIWTLLSPYQPPWLVQLTSMITLHGHAAIWVLAALLVVATLLDVRALAADHRLADMLRAGSRPIGRLERVHARIGYRLGDLAADGKQTSLWAGLASTANDAWYLMARDIADTPRALVAAKGLREKAFAAVVVPRTARIARAQAFELRNGPLSARWAVRVWGLLAFAGLLIAVLWLGTALASHVSADVLHSYFHTSSGNTAGLLQQIGQWWNEQPAWVKGAVIIGAGLVVVATGGSAAAAFAVAGGTLWTLDHAEGLQAFINDPSAATSDYLDTHDAGQISVDVVGAAFSFAPTGSGKLLFSVGSKALETAWAASKGTAYWDALASGARGLAPYAQKTTTTAYSGFPIHEMIASAGGREQLAAAISARAREIASTITDTSIDTSTVFAKTQYNKLFKAANPMASLQSLVVHHAIERQIEDIAPGLFTPEEINALASLRGIPKDINADLHLSIIRRVYNDIYNQAALEGRALTREDIIATYRAVDEYCGHLFVPPTAP